MARPPALQPEMTASVANLWFKKLSKNTGSSKNQKGGKEANAHLQASVVEEVLAHCLKDLKSSEVQWVIVVGVNCSVIAAERSSIAILHEHHVPMNLEMSDNLNKIIVPTNCTFEDSPTIRIVLIRYGPYF